MSNKVKDINIKSRTCYFFSDINIENFDLNNIKIDEKSYKDYMKIFQYITFRIKLQQVQAIAY